ncbi:MULTISPECIES: ATP-binding protein [unclassified Streptomyces]|uniref:ATP-binding protein n=1 Tax=unclassified Streptomyces TaxID=2593676 RepID=UPI0037F7F604
MEEFDFSTSPKLPAAQIGDLAALRWPHAGASVVLFRPVGVGDTCRPGHGALGPPTGHPRPHARFAKTSRILAERASSHADRTREKHIRELVRPDVLVLVLVLDDFAMPTSSPPPRLTTSTSRSANGRTGP